MKNKGVTYKFLQKFEPKFCKVFCKAITSCIVVNYTNLTNITVKNDLLRKKK